MKLWYIRPFLIIEKVDMIAYEMKLPPKLVRVHNIFHVSNLKKILFQLAHIIKFGPNKYESYAN